MKKANHLINEKSPYLQQHAFNPVDWYPWDSAAFAKAKKEDKPVFLSIGYSTCHWCHVMERESFEDEEVAALMNRYFVSIKVDREERPDIDNIYMNVCQMLTGSGGWPMTIIMTPDKKPFFAGTYFPKENRFGRVGMIELIPKLNEIWKANREKIYNSAEEISDALKNNFNYQGFIQIDEKILEKAYIDFSRRFDPQFGGFNTAPKFPTPHNLLFLLRYWKRKNEPHALEIVEKTLLEMNKGGIYDHVGFGFHRYSTDAQWLVPHFEKMLYDQALLIMAYTETFQATGKIIYKNVAEQIIYYVLRDMTSPEGAFYSAEDADSEGSEGKFYLWNKEEIKKVLGKDESELAIKIYNIKDGGNWIDQFHEGKNLTNILHLEKPIEEISLDQKLSSEELSIKIESIRKKLFDFREKRIHPFKDDKILTDWNGLMISALAKASRAFNKAEYADAAGKAAEFILERMSDAKGKLLHRFRYDEAAINAMADDYSFFISGLIDLYESTFKEIYLSAALKHNEYFIGHFWDKESGGFFFTSDDGEKLIIRTKEIYDGAVPSGNSAAVLNLLKLGRFTGKAEFEEMASKIISVFSRSINNSPASFTLALCGLDFALGPSYEIIIASEKNSSSAGEVLNVIGKRFLPNKILILNSDENNIEKISSFVKDQKAVDGKTTVYICRNFSCSLPLNNMDKIIEELNGL